MCPPEAKAGPKRRNCCAQASVKRLSFAIATLQRPSLALCAPEVRDSGGVHLPDGRNIADDYLRRRGWKESVSTREYIAGLRRSVLSLYEVSGLVPGESMLLRDLVRGGDPVRVWEKSGSQGLRPWDRIATRLIPMRDRAGISGSPARLPSL